ncbi:MAG: thioredoxin domain-containing protein, partial [Bacteroidota bacterium]
MSNRLLHTTSPYLLQHAHQPVDWYPWGEEALQKAFQEDKPLLVSIGYAACHWCHVMAREAFEDREAAALMNEHFVCIKVDREERPDVDQVYVAALQAMGLQAGWPLHVFLLPDQQPFYGGNYFSLESWKHLLKQVAQAFRDHRTQLTASAMQFTQALNEESTELAGPAAPIFFQAHQLFDQIDQALDQEYGGLKGAPKFPMPSVGLFLLHYYGATQEEKALTQLHLTLEGMAYGGIYDQLGGGFARYTTDVAWRIPHFEKMLYDNGQLLSLYAQAYTVTKKPLYKRVVEEMVDFVRRELMQEAGGYYSALDADSEGIEGKFYTWTQAEVEEVLGEEAPLFIRQFNIMLERGGWGRGRAHVLYQTADSARMMADEQIEQARQRLLAARA